MITFKRYALAGCAACACGAFGAGAWAQPSAPADSQQDSVAVEEVIVTARRREEELLKVPVSISALSGAQLEQQNVTVTNDLQYSIPGMTFAGTASTRENPPISLRGQGQTFGGALPAVQSYFAEVPTPGSMSTLYDLGSVQVLKGPQGTLFGRNTTGGAILYSPVMPSFGVVDGYAAVRAGNLGYTELEAAVNIPIGDKIALRVSGDILRRDGYTLDLTTNRWIDDQHRDDWRAILSIQATDNLRTDFFATGFSADQNGSSNIIYSVNPNGLVSQPFLAAYNVPGYFVQQQANGNRTTFSVMGQPTYFKRDFWLVSNITTYDVSESLRLKNIIAYQETRTASRVNLAGVPSPVLWQGGPSILDPNDEKGGPGQFSEELQLSGVAFSDRLNWILGGSYIHERPVGVFVQTVQTLGNPVNPAAANPDLKTNDTVTDDYGVFAQGTYDLDTVLNGLSFTAGIRYSVNQQELTALNGRQGVTAGLPDGTFVCLTSGKPANATPAQCSNTLETKSEAPSWNLSLDWQITDDTMVYIASRRGFKAGGFNAFAIDPAIFDYGPEKTTDVEVGLKGGWRLGDDVRLQTTAAAYYSVVDDVQRFAFFFVDVGGLPVGATATRNAGKATISGVELSGTAKFGQYFDLTANYAYTDASIDPAPGVDAGSTFAGVPKNAFSVIGTVHVPLPEQVGDELRLSATWYHQSTVPFVDTLEKEPQAIGPAYSLVNLRADWRKLLGSNASLAVFMNNATDEEYVVDGIIGLNSSFGYSLHAYGAPRTYGVELRYDF
jgi:iron complex outermembrane recepter protein